MALTLLATTLACGGAGPRIARVLPGPGARLDPIYDVTVGFPGTVVVIHGLPYQGLEIDLEIEFDDASVRDDDPAFEAEARIASVLAGGVPQPFSLLGPLDLKGSLSAGALDTGLFGPIVLGTSSLVLELTGTLADGGRHVAGPAALFGTADTGSFLAVKRRRYLVAGSDLTSPIGKVAVVTVKNDSAISIADDLEVVSSDPVARVSDGRPLVVNRFTFDNLQGLDPAADFKTIFQYSVGGGANPHDAVVLPAGAPGAEGARSGVAFVTRYNPPFNDVAILSLDDGTILDQIDLTPYARNADHTPRADQALLHDGLLYVTMEDANVSYTQFMNGRLLVIDPALRKVIDVIDLSGQNPFESLIYSEDTGLIYVGLAGIFPGLLKQALTGGIEAVDPSTRQSRGLLVDDDALGGNVSGVAVASAGRGYCVVSDSLFHDHLMAFDPTSGAVLGSLIDTTDPLQAIAYDGDGFLLVADSSSLTPRILILDAATGAMVTSLPARVPPLSFAILTRSL